MVWEELHVCYFDVGLEAVDFDTSVVVDVGVFFLGNSEELFVVEPFDVADGLVEVEFCGELAVAPVEGGDVAFEAAEEEVAAIAGVVGGVGSEEGELEFEALG